MDLGSKKGWVKLHRSLQDKAFFRKDSEIVHLWIHILMQATHVKREEYLGKKLHTCAPGEFTTDRRLLALETGINASKVERCLTYFEKIEQQIEQRKTRQNRLIIVKNWHLYQESEPQSEPQVNHNRTTSEPHIAEDAHKTVSDQRKKERKCIKERKKELFKNERMKEEYTVCKFDEFYILYPKKRAKKKAIESWMKLKLNDDLFNQIIASLKQDVNSEQWNRDEGKFIPLPATWLNQERWNDSHEKIVTTSAKSGSTLLDRHYQNENNN